MELFKILGTIAIDNSKAIKGIKETTEEADNSSSKMDVAFEKIGASAMKMAKVMAVAMGAGITALTALTKSAVDSYAQYEQLVGGVETIFGAGGKSLEEYAESTGKTVEECKAEYYDLLDAQRAVMDNAREAYKTAGLSANQYMETVTSFSASLIQSLEGDTVQASELANQAIIDMSDNANKMGTDMQMIQNAYNGFAKQNYMMLDNLKLGYGGTKSEMERLLADAEEIQRKQGNIVDYSIDSYADVINAIHDVQTEMGITGTTAQEAEKTISGSLSAMKASWANLVTGLGNNNADLQRLINEFVNSATIAFGNILPVVEKSLKGIAQLVKQIVPQITKMFPSLVEEVLPPLLEATAELIQGLAEAIPELLEMLLEVLPEFVELGVEIIDSILEGIMDNISKMGTSATQIIVKLTTGILQLLPKLLEVGVKLITSIIQGITKSVPQIISTIKDVALQLVQILIANAPQFTQAGLQLIVSLTEGILEALPELLEMLPGIVEQIVSTFLENIGLIIDAGVQLLTALVDNIDLIVDTIIAVAPQIVDGIINALTGDEGGENLAKIAEAGVALLTALIDNMDDIVLTLVGAIPNLINAVDNALTSDANKERMKEAGIDIIYALLEGLVSAWDIVVDWVESGADWIAERFGGISFTPGNSGAVSSGLSGLSGIFTKTTSSGSTKNRVTGTTSKSTRSTSKSGKGVGQYDEGGVIPKGQIAFLEGYGAEAVVPLDRNQKWVSAVAKDMNNALGGNETAQKLDKLIEVSEAMLTALMNNMSIDINQREFARLVRQVNA